MSKGQDTRERIVDRAFRSASRDGLVGLSIGGLAAELGLSKSGLFAHFGSKEELQIAVLEAAAERFEAVVVRPALRAPRGKARIRKWFDHWVLWLLDPSVPGGCIFVAAAAELDDHPGPTRDFLVGSQKQLIDALVKSASLAIEVGDFRKNLDCAQFAFEMFAIVLGFNHAKRLLHDPLAEKRARAAFDRLLASAANPS